MQTAEEIVSKLRANNPGRRFARSKSGGAVGVWSDAESRFRLLYGRLMGCQCMAPYNGGRCQCSQGWAPIPELLVNNKPLVDPSDWIE